MLQETQILMSPLVHEPGLGQPGANAVPRAAVAVTCCATNHGLRSHTDRGAQPPLGPPDASPSSAPAALCLVLGCMIFPDGWDAETIRDMCGEKTGKYSLGDCSVRWAYILAIIGILNALILSFLAFVLGNRQNDLLHEELKTESKGEHRRAGGLGRVRVSWAELAQRGSGERAAEPLPCLTPSLLFPQILSASR